MNFSVMENIKSITDSNLSFYRSLHYFEKYAEFHTLEEFYEYCNWAKSNHVKIYILGNGSNTLFAKKKIKSLILKNQMNKHLQPLPDNRLEVCSSVFLIDVLKYCYENSFDSFYYLASVPATIGGALAMNAGRGRQHQCTIYDFVESVTFFDFESNTIKTLGRENIVKGYRETVFTGIHSCLILSAIFKFNQVTIEQNPIAERCKWSKKFQDNSAPNCGSVFKLADHRILNRLKGFKIGKTSFSSKTYNWILNKSVDSKSILILIKIAKFLHLINGKKAELELITVD
ncbi:FAD-binding protein [Trichocoleus sp. DQ-A3]|uniref:FAD-binding protein n=2 Tax=Cyanobacteriota TaxID=1117 RepID=UPI001F554726|nr:FAD-binding protein [Coleofasciculus sp. FACHB-125]